MPAGSGIGPTSQEYRAHVAPSSVEYSSAGSGDDASAPSMRNLLMRTHEPDSALTRNGPYRPFIQSFCGALSVKT